MWTREQYHVTKLLRVGRLRAVNSTKKERKVLKTHKFEKGQFLADSGPLRIANDTEGNK